MAGELFTSPSSTPAAASPPVLALEASRGAAMARIRRAYVAGVRPDTPLQVSEWADRSRRLPKKSSAEPGPWRTSRTPYLREIMDCLSTTSDVEEVVFMKAAQVGGSETLLNALGYVIDHAPGPVMLVQPTVELAKRFSRQRLDPLFTDTPCLAQKVAEGKSRDAGNTMLSKEFAGGQLIITGANSAVGLRSMPAEYVLFDEVDGYPGDVDEEGSPIDLVEARQRTFARRKRMKVSTPTLSGRSAIESAYEASDRRRFYVPCPYCGEMQPLEFARLVWTKLMLPPARAVYECRACEAPIENHQKTEMLAAGVWRPERPDRVGKVRGYHLNALYAPVGWISWGEIAEMHVKSHRDPERHRVFVNTVLGEVYSVEGTEAPAWEPLFKERRETYTIGTLPMGVLLLTAGVDVQKDRLVYELVGWGRGKRSWSIEKGELPGDTADIDRGPWRDLDAMLEREYPCAHVPDLLMPIRMLAIDSGYNTQTVYNWTRKYPWTRVIPIKGREEGTMLVGSPSPVEINDRGRKLKRGGRVWPVAVSMAKTEFYGWLRGAITGNAASGYQEPAGYCHFPEYDEEYFKQLTAEQLVVRKTRRGFIRQSWELIPGRANHFLDARIYARAAAYAAGLDRFQESDWSDRERMLEMHAAATEAQTSASPSDEDPAPPQAPPSPAPPRPMSRRRTLRSAYLG